MCYLVEIYIGTSGWLYDWNEEASLDWYVKHSGLNAVELNASFYRFPFRNQVIGWSKKGARLRWSIKVHRSITHYRRIRVEALEIWRKFYELFKPLDKHVDFYLFQLPPNYVCREEYLERIRVFYEKTGLGKRFALEFRHNSCFNNEIVEWADRLGLTLVSIDAPIATWIIRSGPYIYLRLHGRKTWYGYDYSVEELEDLVDKTLRLKPEKIYVFFNNNHWMLGNARKIYGIYKEKLGEKL